MACPWPVPRTTCREPPGSLARALAALPPTHALWVYFAEEALCQCYPSPRLLTEEAASRAPSEHGQGFLNLPIVIPQ